MKGNGNDAVQIKIMKMRVAAFGHEAAQRFSKRYFAAVFELLQDFAQRMPFGVFSRIARPSSRLQKIRRARDAGAAFVVLAADV
jgi:hypothetical protein